MGVLIRDLNSELAIDNTYLNTYLRQNFSHKSNVHRNILDWSIYSSKMWIISCMLGPP